MLYILQFLNAFASSQRVHKWIYSVCFYYIMLGNIWQYLFW